MTRTINDRRWHQFSQEVMTGMCDWRLPLPIASLRQIETELDARLALARRPARRRSAPECCLDLARLVAQPASQRPSMCQPAPAARRPSTQLTHPG